MDSTRPKEACVQARVLIEERQALEAIAQMELLTLSEAVRLAIREACKARGLWPPSLPHPKASDSRPEGQRVDERTPDERSEEGEG